MNLARMKFSNWTGRARSVVWATSLCVASGWALGCQAEATSESSSEAEASGQVLESVEAGAPAQTREAEPIVATDKGDLRGAVDSGVYSFKGIPYGASTAGEARFKPPRAVSAWQGVRDATAFGSICPQRGVIAEGRPADSAFGEVPKLDMGEDCLVLNVWSPGLDDATRPVMVWLHGRGFRAGAGSEPMYDGTALARSGDVVVITINHRLNAFGYLHLEEVAGQEFAGSGVAGMLDAIQALEWVRDNARAFGGDPNRVTIFGESGGGAKVSTLLAMPAAKGLFHRAVIQSGAGLRGVSAEEASVAARKVLEQLGIAPEEARTKLAEAPVEDILAAMDAVAAEDPRQFRPTVDGERLPQHPFDPVAAPTSAGVPILIGSNKDEAALFLIGDPKRGALTEDELRQRLQQPLGDRVDSVLSVYRKSRPDASPWDLLVAISTERTRLASILLAERRNAISEVPVFMYRFDWESDYMGGFLKAAHGLEIPFVFDHPEQVVWTGDGPGQEELARAMSQAWVAFARTGDPNHDGIPTWKPYTKEERNTMIFDIENRLASDPQSEERLAWEGIGPIRF